MSQTGEFWEWPWYQKLLSIPLYLFALPFGILIGLFVLPLLMVVGLFAICSNFVGERLFYLSMWNDGRTLSRRKLRRRLDAGETGTLIIEAPTMGWGFTHAWWTPDDVKTLSPVSRSDDAEYGEQVLVFLEEEKAHPWDEWCWREYISTWEGTAILLKVWNGKRYRTWFEQHFPAVAIVETTSAIVHQLEMEAQQEMR